jgi:hypothetical protein
VTTWDVALVVAVTGMVAAMATLRTPRRKALVLAFPVPFTIASLALGRPLDATHVAALTLLFLYTLGVWALHHRLGAPLLAAIATSATGFVLVATALNDLLPRTESAFWGAIAATAAIGTALLVGLPVRDEPGERRELPLAVKLPIVLATVAFLVWVKGLMGGFMTLFPMVGVVASYENRFGLWSNVRQIPVVMVTMLPLMAASRLLDGRFGLAASLAIGWVPFMVVLTPFLLRGWRGAGPGRTAARRRNPI